MEMLLAVFCIFGACVLYVILTGDQETKEYKYAQEEEFNNEEDSSDSFNFYGAQILPAKGNYRITYTNKKGITTKRNITIKRAYKDGENYAVDAKCHLRNANRSFIDERINNAIDIDSGEIVNSVAIHSIKQYDDSSIGKMWNAINNQWVYVYILSYVCRADGRMMEAERDIVSDFIKRRCPSIEFNDNELDDAIKTLGYPDQREFKKLINKMREEDFDGLRDIYECSKRIVATQKKIDPMEKAILETLEKIINNTK